MNNKRLYAVFAFVGSFFAILIFVSSVNSKPLSQNPPQIASRVLGDTLNSTPSASLEPIIERQKFLGFIPIRIYKNPDPADPENYTQPFLSRLLDFLSF